ncbi:hypothetical protein MUK42_11154 [Musa troglodytarum]|uniref:Uncharacterized protein n=1 Tax=Musa troglodytarum TaxID=320322 RepID=A0A9E7KGU0_9LILI|nr:hypothetical protein MUK42_11154 [Musa troglodytarum]
MRFLALRLTLLHMKFPSKKETSIVLWSTSPRSHDSREVPNHDAPHQAMDGPMINEDVTIPLFVRSSRSNI